LPFWWIFLPDRGLFALLAVRSLFLLSIRQPGGSLVFLYPMVAAVASVASAIAGFGLEFTFTAESTQGCPGTLFYRRGGAATARHDATAIHPKLFDHRSH
jgi:hypothetical protein